MVYRILWMSRHKPLRSQIRELERLFGDIEVVQDANPFSDAKDIVQRFREGGFDDIVVVAPLSVIKHLCLLGVHPLWAEMELCSPEEAEVLASGRHYRFKEFKRIVKVEITFAPPTILED